MLVQEQPHSFECEESVCEKKLLVDAAQEKHCLRISGELQKMLVEPKQEYCTGSVKKAQLGQLKFESVFVAFHTLLKDKTSNMS